MKRAALYVRVSTPDQHVESQLYDLRELAAQRGFEVSTNTKIEVFVARRHAVRVSTPSWRMREGRSFPSCWSRLLTALRGALGTFCK